MDLIKVSGTSRTSAVAGAIAGVFRDYQRAEVQAIGAQAVNQAVKSLALARRYLQRDSIDIVIIPEFVEITIEEKIRTAIRFTVEIRERVAQGPSSEVTPAESASPPEGQ
jgi:stage V sporulation protein S